jgi:hypothetical protein
VAERGEREGGGGGGMSRSLGGGLAAAADGGVGERDEGVSLPSSRAAAGRKAAGRYMKNLSIYV